MTGATEAAKRAPGEDTPIKLCDRMVGRWQRQVRWALIENVIWVCWGEVRNGYSRGMLPKVGP